MFKQIWVLGFLIVGLVSGVSVSNAAPILINGAGATFPYPIYSKWFDEYRKKDAAVQINYSSIGSGGGIRQLIDETVDFGASDAPMNEEEMTKAAARGHGAVIHIPTVLGAVVVSYNLPDLKMKGNLNLSGDVISKIYRGKITHWNDAAIAALNKGVDLPNLAIFPVYRSDGSGTTAVFTDYLAKVSAEWKSEVGAGKSVKFPAGIGAKGNEGVSGMLKQTPGGFGYVELAYAETNHLSIAALQNKKGKFVLASTASVTAAAAASAKSMPEDFRVSITDADGDKAYSIAAFTYLLIYQQMPKEKGQHILNFIKWAMGPGQSYAQALTYAPLPSALVKKVNQKLTSVTLK